MKILAAVFLCVAVAAALASPQRAQEAGAAAPASTPKLDVPLTRFALVDSRALAGDGIKLEKKDSKALADLKAFGEGLNVDFIDSEKLQGTLFVADDRLDLTDAFLVAWKARRSKSLPLEVPDFKVQPAAVAFIDTDAFSDPKIGITKLVKAEAALEAEFKPRKEEIEKLKEQLKAGSGDRKRLKSEIKRRQEAGQTALNQKHAELIAPIFKDIADSLAPFCKIHGIALIFNTTRIKKTDKLAPFDVPFPADTPDVTAAFVSAYNQGALLHNILIP